MVGTLPKTNYLLLKGDTLIGQYEAKVDIFLALGGSISEAGIVTFLGEVQTMSYTPIQKSTASWNDWHNTHEMMIDYARSHMDSQLVDHTIHRVII